MKDLAIEIRIRIVALLSIFAVEFHLGQNLLQRIFVGLQLLLQMPLLIVDVDIGQYLCQVRRGGQVQIVRIGLYA